MNLLATYDNLNQDLVFNNYLKYVYSYKLNGHRVTVRLENKTLKMYSNKNRDRSSLMELNKCPLPGNGYIGFEGELVCSKGFNELNSIVSSHNPTPDQLKTLSVHFYDYITTNKDRSFVQRYTDLMSKIGTAHEPYFYVIKQYLPSPMNFEQLQVLTDVVRKNNEYEGIVFRDAYESYENRKMFKYKPFETTNTLNNTGIGFFVSFDLPNKTAQIKYNDEFRNIHVTESIIGLVMKLKQGDSVTFNTRTNQMHLQQTKYF